MSFEDQSVVRVMDPRIDVEDIKTKVVAVQGANTLAYNVLPAQTGTALSPIKWQVLPGNYGTGISRTMRIHVQGTITITTAQNGMPAANALNIALRQFPLHQCITNISATVNGTRIQLSNPNQYIAALAQVNSSAVQSSGALSSSEASVDLLTRYVDSRNALTSPFRAGYDSIPGAPPPRTRNIVVNRVDAQTATVTFDLHEVVFLPPFQWGGDDAKKALFGVQELNIDVSVANIQRMLCWAGTVAVQNQVNVLTSIPITAITMNAWSAAPELEFVLVTPHSDSFIHQVPALYYDATDYQFYQTLAQACPQGQTRTVTSQAYQLATVPRLALIWVALAPDVYDFPQNAREVQPDWFYAIQSLQIKYGTQVAYNGANAAELWAASMKAGLVCDYPRFAGLPIGVQSGGAVPAFSGGSFASAPLVFDFGIEGQLPEGVSPGVDVSMLFTATVTYRNQSVTNVNDALVPFLSILFLTDAELSLFQGKAAYRLGGLTAHEVASAPVESRMSSKDILESTAGKGAAGGSFLSFLKDAGSALARDARKGLSIGARILSPIATVAGLPQVGAASAALGKALGSGGLMLGGAYESREDLRARLRRR